MFGLNFFRSDSAGGINIITYHSPHSLTWSWGIAFIKFRAGEKRYWPIFWHYRRSCDKCLCWGFRVPFIGHVQYSSQPAMWYKDLYRRLRKDVDKLEIAHQNLKASQSSLYTPKITEHYHGNC